MILKFEVGIFLKENSWVYLLYREYTVPTIDFQKFNEQCSWNGRAVSFEHNDLVQLSLEGCRVQVDSYSE